MNYLHFIADYWLEILFFLTPIFIGIQAVLHLMDEHNRGKKRTRLLIQRSKNNMYSKGFADGKRQQIEYVKTMDSEQWHEFFNK